LGTGAHLPSSNGASSRMSRLHGKLRKQVHVHAARKRV